jgi:hypothetical protein
MTRAVLAWLIASVTVSAVPAAGQSLAEIARKEQARRKALTGPSRLYTDEDIKRFARPAATGPASEVPGTLPSGAAVAGQVKPDEQPAAVQRAVPAPDPAKEEQAWRDRITTARARLERSKLFLDALQSRVNALTNDFYARDDPAQRALIEADRKRALAEMERVKQDIKDATKAIADIEEQARLAGVPPGWLR